MQPCPINLLSKPNSCPRFYSVLSQLEQKISFTIIIVILDPFVLITSYFHSLTAMSFDLYAKYGNNRTLSLVSPKKPYYQWRLRVPSGHVVRLVILTLQGATPGSCSANKLSAYDFLLPLQNKIIARYERHRWEGE